MWNNQVIGNKHHSQHPLGNNVEYPIPMCFSLVCYNGGRRPVMILLYFNDQSKFNDY